MWLNKIHCAIREIICIMKDQSISTGDSDNKCCEKCPTYLERWSNETKDYVDVDEFTLTVKKGTADISVNGGQSVTYGTVSEDDDRNIYKTENYHRGDITVVGSPESIWVTEYSKCGSIDTVFGITTVDDIVEGVYEDGYRLTFDIDVMNNDSIADDILLSSLNIKIKGADEFGVLVEDYGVWRVNSTTTNGYQVITFEPSPDYDDIEIPQVQYCLVTADGVESNESSVLVRYTPPPPT